MNDFGLADILRRAVGKIHFDDRVDGKLDGAGTEEATEAYVLSGRILFDFIAEFVGAAQFERNTQTHADFRARDKAANLVELREASAQRVEVNGFLEIGKGPELLAVIFGLRAALAADDDHGDFLGEAERRERLQEFIAGILRHAKIQQDGFGLVLESKSQTVLGHARVDDVKAAAEFEAYQAPQSFVVVHNQLLVHCEISPIGLSGCRLPQVRSQNLKWAPFSSPHQV